MVLHHENRRVIVPTDAYPKYSDVLDFVRREWDIKLQNMIFETNELDVCYGEWVRIHEDAWPGLKDVIGNVHARLWMSGSTTQLQNGDSCLLEHEDILT